MLFISDTVPFMTTEPLIRYHTDQLPDHLNTLYDVIRFAASAMSSANCYFGHGTDNAFDEAVALVLGALSLPHHLDSQFFVAKLTADEKQLLADLLTKRIKKRVPLPYLLHKAWFMNLPFYVTPEVLIPRSPLAESIEQSLAPWVREPESVRRILDLCCGSGCIGIACAYTFSEAEIVLADISSAALLIAEHNIQQHGLEANVTAVKSNVFSGVKGQQFDVIISNPPYVSTEEMQSLPEEYLHEPRLALEAEEEGLAIVHQILVEAADYLTPEGILIVEVGSAQWAMEQYYPDLPITWIEFQRGGEGVFTIDSESLQRYFA